MKIVILYSGGLDSFLLYNYAKIEYPDDEVVCLYFRHGADSEESEISRLPNFVQVRTVEWLNETIRPLAKKDDPFAGNIYIPGRNLVFSVLAATQELPDEIWMGTVWDEDNEKATDKNEKFRNETSSLLSYVLSPFLDSVKIRFPFVENSWTKEHCVAWALRNNISKNEIVNTVSCWHHDGQNCGHCKQCFKRKLIFLLTGLTEDYKQDPINSEYGKGLIKQYLEAKDRNRDEENVRNQILRCYERDLFDDETIDFIDDIVWRKG